jgi:hypothetical protein
MLDRVLRQRHEPEDEGVEADERHDAKPAFQVYGYRPKGNKALVPTSRIQAVR